VTVDGCAAAVTFSVIVCAFNEEQLLPGCLHSLLQQSFPPHEIFVINNASTDRTAAAASIPGIRVVDEPRKGLVIARETGRRVSTGDVLVYVDADCRAPRDWLGLVAREFAGPNPPAALTGPYRFHDWDIVGRVLVRMYDYSLAPLTHVLVQYVFRLGAVLYGGNFAVRRDALEAIGGFDTSIEFHGEDTNLARRISKTGRVRLRPPCWGYTSARRYKTMGRGKVFGLYVRNFCAEILFYRPSDTTHEDVRA
jgi:glycosyltransferase involved in cell wall biosynthesis